MQLSVGTVVEGKVSKITNFGAFINIDGGGSGMVHISEVANTYVKDINEHLKVGDSVKAKVVAINENNKSPFPLRHYCHRSQNRSRTAVVMAKEKAGIAVAPAGIIPISISLPSPIRLLQEMPLKI